MGQNAVLAVSPDRSFVRDMTSLAMRCGWKLVSDAQYKAGKVELIGFLRPREISVCGVEVANRAIRLNANPGQRHLEAFLAKYERWAPPKCVDYIAFPGTVWQNEDRLRSVLTLCWNGERWHLDLVRLDGGWRPRGCLLRPCSE